MRAYDCARSKIVLALGRLQLPASQSARADYVRECADAERTAEFPDGSHRQVRATPIISNGTLYVTGALDHAWALDGRTGKQLWHYQRFPGTEPPAGLKVCCGLVNGGFAVWHDKLYMTTLDAHLVADL